MSVINDACDDDRFELIAKAKQKLLDATNIDSRPDEIAALDNILFRCWQMGWLDQLRDADTRWQDLFGTPERAARTLIDCNAFKNCVDCPVCHDEYGETCEIPGDCAFVMRGYHKLLEWLRGDAPRANMHAE